jgi:hypothetical protein
MTMMHPDLAQLVVADRHSESQKLATRRGLIERLKRK